MDCEDIIEWNKTESIFEEDDTYENINAPKWVDLSAPSQTIDDEAWFCKPGCKHPKCVEDYLKSKHYTKVKLLRSRSISENFPFRDRTRREAKAKNGEKGSKPSQILSEDNENKNPNISHLPKKLTKKPSSPLPKKLTMTTDQYCDDSRKKSVFSDMKKKGLKITFSARNLVGGRDIISQISGLKKMATKGSKMGGSSSSSSTKGCDDSGVLGELKERVRERERIACCKR